jgi:hypothetical protein
MMTRRPGRNLDMARSRLIRVLVLGGAVGVAILTAWLFWPSGNAVPAARPVEIFTDGYVGSKTCQSCHADQHATWHQSYHRTMTQPATEESVIGDFNNVRLHGKDLNVRLFKEGGRFMAELNFRNPTMHGTYPVVMTTGSHHRQAYWLANPDDSKLMILPYMYLREEKRWIPRHAGYIGTLWQHERPEIDLFQGEYGRWSAICIKCHTTHGQPHPVNEAGAASVVSRVAEFGISCEACHGPGAAHVAANRDSSGPPKTGIVNPARLPHDRSAQVCGQCHSVLGNRSEAAHQKWTNGGDAFRPGDDLFADPILYLIRGRADLMPDRPAHIADPATSGSFWPDGMIRVTGREFNGLIESPCYQRGKMSCLSCHLMHQRDGDQRPAKEWAAGQLKPGMDGNRACLQCHERFQDSAAVKQHTHHSAESSGSACYNCHMPNTTYGILKATRSHQVTSPSVAVSLQSGRPNACNLCHQDKTLAWTADHLTEWYKQPKPKLSQDEQEVSAMVLWALSGDAGQRAVTAWNLGWPEAHQASGNHWQAPVLAQLLDDPYDGVRFVAQRSLKRLPGFADFDYDFVGPTEKRSAAVQRARHVWERNVSREKRSFTRPMLVDPDGKVLDADIQRFLKLRDDRPIDISE